jgi:hypothetical protein
VADRLELGEVVGEAEQGGAAREEFALEVGAQPIAEDGEVEDVGDVAELPDLLGGEELGLVDQHAGDRSRGVGGAHLVEQVVAGGDRDGGGVQPDARLDAAGAVAGVDRRGEKQGAHAALLVVVARLEQDGALARVHRGVVKIDLGHGRVTVRGAGGKSSLGWGRSSRGAHRPMGGRIPGGHEARQFLDA